MLEISWEDYQKYCEVLGDSLKKSGDDQLPLILIGRGGYIVGTILSHYLNNRNIYTLDVRSYVGQTANTLSYFGHQTGLKNMVKETKELVLIDDLLDTGNTLKWVKEWILQVSKKTIVKTACVLEKPDISKMIHKQDRPVLDHSAFKAPNVWIKFPYEYD